MARQRIIITNAKEAALHTPAIRLFTVLRTSGEQVGVEAHNYYVGHTGQVCFRRLVWCEEDKTLLWYLPLTMAPGTWVDVVERDTFQVSVVQ